MVGVGTTSSKGHLHRATHGTDPERCNESNARTMAITNPARPRIRKEPGSGSRCVRNIQPITAHGGDYLEANRD